MAVPVNAIKMHLGCGKLHLHECVFVYWVSACVRVHMHVHFCACQKVMFDIFLKGSPPVSLRQDFSPNLELAGWHLTGSEASERLPSLPLQCEDAPDGFVCFNAGLESPTQFHTRKTL